MTTRIKTSLAAAIAAVSLMAAAPILTAQDQPRGAGPGMRGPGGPGMRGPGGGPRGFGPGFRALDLTDDQKAQLKTIADSHRDEFRAARDKARAARDGMQALVEADTLDESAIRAKSTEIAAAEADIMILNAKVRHESRQVLTSEQQTKLKELRTTRQDRMKQRRPGRQ
jgi:periplasmic protein CpxP/Spy